MPLNARTIAKTSAAGNNCAFHCVAHWFINNLLAGNLNEILDQEASYLQLKTSFQEHYGEGDISWDQIKQLFQAYTNPYDRELILGPVLRKNLHVLLTQDPNGLKDLLKDSIFIPIIRKILQDESLEPTDQNVYHSNIDFINGLKLEFEKRQDQTQTVDSFIEEQQDQIDQYWQYNGYRFYYNALGNGLNEICLEELRILTDSLGINLEAYAEVQNDEDQVTRYNPTLQQQLPQQIGSTLTVVNTQSKTHWVHTADTQQHNKNFFKNSVLMNASTRFIKQQVRGNLQAIANGNEPQLRAPRPLPQPPIRHDSKKYEYPAKGTSYHKFLQNNGIFQYSPKWNGFIQANAAMGNFIDKTDKVDGKFFDDYFNQMTTAVQKGDNKKISQLEKQLTAASNAPKP